MTFFSLGCHRKIVIECSVWTYKMQAFNFLERVLLRVMGHRSSRVVVDFVSEIGCLILAGLELTMKPRMALNF